MNAPSHRPVARAIPFLDPAACFSAFADEPVAALLDSAAVAGGRGRHAYIAADPFLVLSWRRDGPPADPFGEIAALLGTLRLRTDPDLPPFQTGAVGYLGYELGGSLERLPGPRREGPSLPDLFLAFYDTIIAFDLKAGKAWIVASDVAAAFGRRRPPAVVRVETLARRIASIPSIPVPGDGAVPVPWRTETPRARYEAMVRRAISYIRAGDIYQANLSHRLLASNPKGVTPYELYLRVRRSNPAPFAALLNCGAGQALLSASPERFLRLDPTGRVETRPIKGTRPRGRTPEEDAELARQLRESAKDRAENLMIVDLLRNDLSRVARIGSVQVPQLCGLESFANVHHLVSAVEARLREGLGPIDLLRATFPGGSITGAPKIRAMEIISELEPARRGPYCGSILWMGFDGAMDSSITIRTIVLDGSTAILQAGGGIVADSDPAAEYEETMDKVGALMTCLSGTFP